MRISTGCVSSYFLPGMVATAASISRISTSFGLRGSGQSARSLIMMKVSATDGGIGSVATSAVPILPTIISTSGNRSEEHTSELQSLMRISYAVLCLKKKKKTANYTSTYVQDKKPTSK